MADKKISALTAASTPLAGTEVLPIVQSGSTVKVAVSDLTAGRTFSALGMTLTSTDAGATAAPLLDLYRDSATPAASDTLGEIEFNGEDSAGNKQTYGVIHGSILSPTSTAEQGQLHFETATAGALTEKMIIGTTNLVINDIGAVYNVRIEGDTDANLFYTDATNDRIGVGTITPRSKLDVSGGVLVGTYQTSTNYAPLSVKTSSTITTPSTFTNAINIWNGTNVGEYSNITFGYNSLGLTNANAYIGFVSTSSAGQGKGDLVFGTRDVTTDTAATERMRIDSAGIVTMSAYGAGAATFSAAGVISSVSDERWKIKDGVPSNPDAMLKKLEPGYWYYNDEKKETFGADRQLGFYAQNVNAAIGPEAAPEPEEGKPWGYYDRSVLAVTVMALQKALVTIELLEARLDAANL